MPRNFIAVFILLGLASTSQAQVPCNTCGGGTRMSGTQISGLLGGNTVCAILNTERWQEYHTGTSTSPSGDVHELGNTPGGEVVGRWFVSGTEENPTVTYDYGSGGSYTYAVCNQNPLYHFCGAKNVTNASVIPGKTPCP